MPAMHEIRADYDQQSIVVYQAYNDAIANAALGAGRFVAPFSFQRMTWIKPSFLWLMARSNWGTKSGQERTLAVRITRTGWERALSLAVPTDPTAGGFKSHEIWRKQFDNAAVHVQWDTERALRGGALNWYSIQVGLSRQVIREFAEQWIVSIVDLTERVQKIRAAINTGHYHRIDAWLPRERVYPLSTELQRRLGMQR